MSVEVLATKLKHTDADIVYVAQVSTKRHEPRFQLSADMKFVRSTRREKLHVQAAGQQADAGGGIAMQMQPQPQSPRGPPLETLPASSPVPVPSPQASATTTDLVWPPPPPPGKPPFPANKPPAPRQFSCSGLPIQSNLMEPAPQEAAADILRENQPLSGDLEPGNSTVAAATHCPSGGHRGSSDVNTGTISSSRSEIGDFDGLSRAMSIVLRYGGKGLGCLIDSNGFAPVSELAVKFNRTEADVLHVARISAKGLEQRFELSTDGMNVRSTRREKLHSRIRRQQTSVAAVVDMQTAQPPPPLESAQSPTTPLSASWPSQTPTALPTYSVADPPPPGQPKMQDHLPPPPLEPEKAKLTTSIPVPNRPPAKDPEPNGGREAAMVTKDGMASHMHQPKGMPWPAAKEAEAEAETKAEGGATSSEQAATAGSTSEVCKVYEF